MTGVSWWDASARREYEISESFRDFLGLKSCHAVASDFEPFTTADFIESCHRRVGCGDEVWTGIFRVRGKEHRLRFMRVSDYVDADGVKHVIGCVAPYKTEEPQQKVAPVSYDAFAQLNYSLMDSLNTVSKGGDSAHVSLYDRIADMMRTFRSHFPPGVSVSAWMHVADDEFCCVALSGEIYSRAHADKYKVGSRIKSAMYADILNKPSVTTLRDEKGPSRTWAREAEMCRAVGFDNSMYYRVPDGMGGKSWGVISCGTAHPRVWSSEDKLFIMLLSDAIMVLLAQTSVAERLHQHLVLTRMACAAGQCYTWLWDVKAQKRYVLANDGRYVLATYDLMTHRSDASIYTDAYCDIIEGKTDSFKIKLRMRTISESRIRWFEVSAKVAQYDESGMPLIIVGVGKDIDDDVKREHEEKSKVDFQNSVYNHIPAAIAFCDKAGDTVFVNERCVQMHGCRSKRDFDGVNIFQSPAFSEETKLAIRTQDNNDFTVDCDFALLAESGYLRTLRRDVLHVQVRTSKLYTGGIMSGYMFVFTDTSVISLQRRRLQLFTDFFAEIGRFAKLGICQFGKGGFASAQWNLNLALPPSDTHPDIHMVCPAVNPTELAVINSRLQSVAKGEIKAFQREVKVAFPGRSRYVLLHFMYSESVDAVTAISLDVTEQREREEALKTSLRKSERVDSFRTKFVENVSHELRTPLNAIVGFSDLIAETQKEGELSRYAQIIRDSSGTLVSLVDGIMELSQIQTGNRKFGRELVSIDGILSSVKDRMMPYKPANVQFLCSHDPEIGGLMAAVDKVAVEQVLCKLIANAFEFTDKGCVMLWCDVNDSKISFHVSDTGCGIESDKLDSIFEFFVKLNTFNKGAGLGLPICQGLAQKMGGHVGVESTFGKGSHFWLELPFVSEVAHKSKSDAVELNTCNNAMVCSSVPELSLQLSLILVKANVIRVDREELLSVWMQCRPELVIMDVRSCPDSALSLVSNIASLGEGSVVIAINEAYTNISNAELIEAGAVEVIDAPFPLSHLTEVVAKYVNSPLRLPGNGSDMIS